jgi:hypothetical protein
MINPTVGPRCNGGGHAQTLVRISFDGSGEYARRGLAKMAVGARHRSLFERRFQLEKAAPKLFNRSCSALFFS